MFYFVTLNEHYSNFEAFFSVVTRVRGNGAIRLSQLCWKAAASLITGSHLYLIFAQHRPKPLVLIEEETRLTAGFSSRPAGMKICRFLHIYVDSWEKERDRQRKGGGVHCVHVPGHKQTEHDEETVLYVLTEADFIDYVIYRDTILPLKPTFFY